MNSKAFSILIFSLMLASCVSTSPIQEPPFQVTGPSSEITFTTTAPNWLVNAYLSDSNVDCEDFRHAARLFYDAQLRGGGIIGAIRKFDPIKPDENLTVTHKIPNDSVIQVKAGFSTSGAFFGSCGPIYLKFGVGNENKYHVHFHLDQKEKLCTALVTAQDALGQPVPVRTTDLYCRD